MTEKRHFNTRLFVLLLTGLAAVAFTGNAQDQAAGYAGTITAGALKKHLRIIAADSLEGRYTGSAGQRKAAEYVASHFKSYGLEPAAVTETGVKTYFQKYELYRRGWGEVYLKAGDKTYRLNKEFTLNGLVDVPEETAVETVWAGYGIEADRYSDYGDRDVKGKAVVVYEGEPVGRDGNYLVTGTREKSKWGAPQGWQSKVNLALSKGARFLIVITSRNEEEFRKEIQRRVSMTQRVSPLTLKPVEESLNNVAAFTVNRDAAAALLNTRPKVLEQLKNKIAKSGNPVPKTLEGTVRIKAVRVSETVDTENVAGFIEGSDKKDEVLVISAHLDHIGISPDGQINNGADDDGSGTVSLLELARAFGQAKAEGHGPRRSILFLNVTGEELGLFGSEYYSEHPLFPLKNTIANLNIDMIGRIDEAHKDNPEYVYLIGSDKLSSELHQISEDANRKYVNFKLDYTYNDPNDPNRFYYRSDHYNFAKKGIPVIFYFTGVHEDYHRPGDDVEKILFDKQVPIVKLIFHTAWELANREERIKVDSNKP